MPTSATVGPLFEALHDSTRRRVLELLRDGEQSVRQLTDQVPVTQSAVSQHLRVLRDAGLVVARPAGTRRLYRIDIDGLSAVRAWVDSFWDDALAAFVAHAEAGAPPRAKPSAAPSEPDAGGSTSDASAGGPGAKRSPAIETDTKDSQR